MTVDFFDSHKRHWEGAELLYKNSHWANADHLYGLSAECGVKALMCAFGMSLDSSGRPPHSDREHINKLGPRYEAYRSGNHSASYSISFVEFANWDVFQRYVHKKGFTKAYVGIHKDACDAICKTVMAAKLHGVIQ